MKETTNKWTNGSILRLAPGFDWELLRSNLRQLQKYQLATIPLTGTSRCARKLARTPCGTRKYLYQKKYIDGGENYLCDIAQFNEKTPHTHTQKEYKFTHTHICSSGSNMQCKDPEIYMSCMQI